MGIWVLSSFNISFTILVPPPPIPIIHNLASTGISPFNISTVGTRISSFDISTIGIGFTSFFFAY